MAYCGPELEVGLVQQYDILKPNGKFKGKSYSEWAEEWWTKLLSADPDGYRKDDDVVFLRGKYDYVDKGKMREPQTKPNVNKRLGNNGLIICEGTSLFFPVIAAEFNEGDVDPDNEKKTLRNENECSACAKKDIDEGGQPDPKQVTINNDPIVDDFRPFRVKSKFFPLMVPKNSSLKDKMEYVIPDGTYKGVTDGYWILIKSLPASKVPYRLRFSATGRNQPKTNQYSNAGEYEIMVERCS
jgi:hypothetical protein